MPLRIPSSRAFIFALFLSSIGSVAACAQTTVEAHRSYLRDGFVSPPPDARLRCYWWWLNGNTTEETITSDLREMSRMGYGGVLLVDANGSNQKGNSNVPPGPTFGSPAWTRLYVKALKVAAELHLEVTLNITSGWNLGGPDVTPAEASKVLTWARTIVADGHIDGTLAMPATKNGIYRQIAVLAYPLRHGTELAGANGDKRAGVRGLEYRTAAEETGISMERPEPLLGASDSAKGEEDFAAADVVEVTALADQAGHMVWQAPAPGPWEILRIGYTDSDARVSTSSGAWQGLAIDYLDRGAFDRYWDHTVLPLLEAARPYLGTTLTNLATDSWELGGTNWTERFAEEFRHRRGYDPIPYLPAVAGRIVEDRTVSDRFLNDLRRTVGDLVTDHYDHFAERAKVYGLGVQSESGGPHGAPMDALETFRSSAVPQTEFWAQSNEHRTSDADRFFTKEAASAVDIYGQKFVAEEGMTSIGPQWNESPATDLKPSFDQAITEGMNRLVWHEFTSSPAAYGVPGNEYFAGTHMNPRVTWWSQARLFFLYLNRCQFLMQQGHAVDDVLYFYGNEVPNFVRLKRDDPAHVLPGFDYDVTNEDALLRTLQVERGQISTPAGNRYKLLAMPVGSRLSVASLERIAEYVREGGSVVGPAPVAPTGILQDAALKRFSQLVQEMWGKCGSGIQGYGAGKVFCGLDTRAALKNLGVAADFESDVPTLDYIHRVDGGTHIYFVRNTSGVAVEAVATFRVTGQTPEVWNPLDGRMAPQMVYKSEDGRTRLALHLAPFGSMFVLFQEEAHRHITGVTRDGREIAAAVATSSGESGITLKDAVPGLYTAVMSDGSGMSSTVARSRVVELPAHQWTITFQAGRGAPEGAHSLEAFTSWAESRDAGVRYFSGTATYRTAIDLAKQPRARYILRLTEVHELCTVRINGKDAGTIWAMPFDLDVTNSLRTGQNAVELEVTNLWPNRIIGDAQPGATRRYTQTNIRKYNAASPLLPSGLVGPVLLATIPEARFN